MGETPTRGWLKAIEGQKPSPTWLYFKCRICSAQHVRCRASRDKTNANNKGFLAWVDPSSICNAQRAHCGWLQSKPWRQHCKKAKAA